MTHGELVERAGRWLKNTMKMNPVFTECGSMMISEFPDAIGFGPHESILVECKISINDFRADYKKPSRKYPELGMGNRRYFFIPDSLELKHVWVTEKGWGLARVKKNIVKVEIQSAGFQANLINERRFLRSRILNN